MMSTYPLARDLRDRVKFQRRTPITPDAYGGSSGAWFDLIASRPVQIVPFRPRRKGGDEVIDGRLQGTAPFDLYVRFDSQTSQVTADDRAIDLRDPKRVFQIGFAQDMDGRRVWITMQLELGVAT